MKKRRKLKVEVSDLSVLEFGGGNKQPPLKEDNSYQTNNWIMTWNNYPENVMSVLRDKLIPLCKKYVFSKEIGDEGTPHIQGAFCLCKKINPKNGLRQNRLYKIIGATMYLHQMEGRWNDQKYCVKDNGECLTNVTFKLDDKDFDLKLEDLPPLLPWQEKIAERHKAPPELFHTTIYWYWGKKGQIGKTMLARYFNLKYGGIYLQGAGRHIIAVAYKNPSFWYVFGLTRSDCGKISYRSLESLNDNFYMSGFGTKATGMKNRKTAWTIVFANFPPDIDKLSLSRWHVENVETGELGVPPGFDDLN